MYKNILVPTDGSALSSKAIKHAIALAKATGATLTFIHAMPSYEAFVKERYNILPVLAEPVKDKFKAEFAATSHTILNDACAPCIATGIKCAGVSVNSGSPYEAIIKQATKLKCDLIVMASHGRRGLDSILLGSETQKVLTHSKIPVLVVR